MREISDVEMVAELPRVLDAVEHGESVFITRAGRIVARLVPEARRDQAQIESAIADIRAMRETMPRLTSGDIRELIAEGRKY